MSEALIEYERSGGIAGLRDRLVIQEDGSAVVARRETRREIAVGDAALLRLLDALQQAQFAVLPPDSRAEGRDLMTYRIVYRGHVVRAMDAAVPPPLQPVLRLLNEILDR